MYADATRGVLPIIIYGFEENNLSSWDLIELTELRRLANDLCFFFAIVPPRDVYESMCVPQLASVKPSRLKPRRVFRGASSVAKAVTSNAKRLTVATPSAHTPSPSIMPKPQDNVQPTKGSPGVCGAIDSHCSVQGEEKPCFANHLSFLLLQLGFLSRESTREQSKGTCEDLEYHSRRLSEVVRKPMRSSRRKISLVCSNYPTHFDARLAVETE
ncbi:unnamed protein product [Schistocephalus solidus]|uniref:Uncharacterized protein n=1 Tax=Schistocephalus solidus TaxID=70667 RepID=A0A183THK3_SCHSO|nr:unnamed protein product [Schistocephalus solidus]